MKKCARQDCDNPLKTGSKYCSRSCATKARSESKDAASEFSSLILDRFGGQFQGVVDEIVRVALQNENGAISVPFPTRTVAREDVFLSSDGKKEYRPMDALDFDTIEMMERSGPVMFATWMMMARIIKVFSDGRYVVDSPDEELIEVAKASLARIMPKMARDFIYGSFTRGTYFGEKRFMHATKYELGLSKSRSAVTPFAVPNVPISVNPRTIRHINRTNGGKSFNGFTQEPKSPDLDEKHILLDSALVIPYNSIYGNLWGKSFFDSIYPIWVWYEITLRAMARYVDKEAKPITYAKAPSRSVVEMADGNEVDALDLALILAGSLAHSNAVAIPSDQYENGQPKWEIGHLVSQDRSNLFIGILEYLSNEIIRAALSAENSIARASGGVGSRNIGEVHLKASALVAEIILLDYLFYLNKYFMPDYSYYNRGTNGPPIWLKTQPIDESERETLLKLIGVAGNSPSGERFFSKVDWRQMAETSNIPTITDEEAEELSEDEFEKGLDHQKKQMEMLAKVKQPSQPGQGAESNPNPASQVKAPAGDGQEKLMRQILDHGIMTMSSGDLVRLGIASVHDLDTNRIFYFNGGTGGGVFDESKVNRDEKGKFAKKRSASRRKSSNPDVQKILDEIANIKEISDSLDLTDEQRERMNQLLEILSAIEAGTEEYEQDEEKRKEVEDFIRDTKNALEFFEKIPKFDDVNEAAKFYSDFLQEQGINGLQITSAEINPDSESLGYYLVDDNKLVLRNEIMPWLESGHPLAAQVLIHELLHSNQEVNRGLAEGEAHEFTIEGNSYYLGNQVIFDNPNHKEIISFMKYAEGQNELLSRIMLNRMTGFTATDQAYDVFNFVHNGGEEKNRHSYEGEVAAYAQALQNVATKRGVDPIGLLISEHNNGFDMAAQRAFLTEASGGSFEYEPPETTIGNFKELIAARDNVMETGFTARISKAAPELEGEGPK